MLIESGDIFHSKLLCIKSFQVLAGMQYRWGRELSDSCVYIVLFNHRCHFFLPFLISRFVYFVHFYLDMRMSTNVQQSNSCLLCNVLVFNWERTWKDIRVPLIYIKTTKCMFSLYFLFSVWRHVDFYSPFWSILFEHLWKICVHKIFSRGKRQDTRRRDFLARKRFTLAGCYTFCAHSRCLIGPKVTKTTSGREPRGCDVFSPTFLEVGILWHSELKKNPNLQIRPSSKVCYRVQYTPTPCSGPRPRSPRQSRRIVKSSH